MGKHTMVLDDQVHRTLKLNTELSDTAATKISVKVTCEDVAGKLTNFLIIKSTVSENLIDEKIPVNGIKIPPNLDPA